jgi:di/tricarboxylate transporter
MFLFLASLVVNLVIGIVVFFVFGGRTLLGQQRDDHTDDAATQQSPDVAATQESPDVAAGEHHQRTREQNLTLAGLTLLAVAAVGFDLDVGFTAFAIALVLALLSPDGYKHALNDVAWSVVILVGGVLTYVNLMEEIGTIDYVGNAVANLAAPLVVALLLCYIGGIVSAFASSVAILGSTIPLAVPFLQDGAISAVAMIAALSVSSTVVDCSPLSTNGALVLANSVDVDRDVMFRRLMIYGAFVVALAPPLIWLAIVVPAG